MSSPNPHADPENTRPNRPFAKKRVARKMPKRNSGVNDVRYLIAKVKAFEGKKRPSTAKVAPTASEWKAHFADRAADRTPVHLRKWGAQDPKNPRWKR